MPFPLIPLAAAGIGAAAGGALAGRNKNKGGKTNAAGLQQAGFFKGAPGQFANQSLLNPQQQQLQNLSVQQLMQALGGLQLPGQNNQNIYQGFEPIEQDYQDQLNAAIPSLANRFTMLGGNDTRLQSSGFAHALSNLIGNQARGLAGLKAQYGQNQQANQQANFFNLLRSGLGQSQENFYQPPQLAGYQNLLNGLAGGAGGLGTLYGASKLGLF